MKGKQHLTKPQQYTLVYRKGNSWTSSLAVMKALPNGLPFSRYGFSVSKRVGQAVARNRMKRRLREILRVEPLKPGWDIVLIIRPAAASADYAALKSLVDGLLLRAGLLETKNGPGCLDGVNSRGGMGRALVSEVM